MAAHLETWSKEEIRAVIRFLNAKSLNPTEIHKELQSVYGEHVISRTQVYHWCNLFEAGHSDLTDREGRGLLITAASEDNVKRVDELIRQHRRLKLHEIASSLEISETSAHRIVFDELGYRKVSARWVPKHLTDNHKEQRLDICRELLRRSKSSHRVRGVLLFETLQPGETINAARYCQTLDKLREAIRRKRPGQLTNGVILQHDNATPHTARVTQGWLEKYGWEILPHPPQSPDLAPSDYHLFGPLKRELAGKSFDDDEELVDHVRKWLQNLDGSFFREGIYSMVRRWQKCVDRLDCYV
ncbi:histone-lysine N-methyltransferase SETMAR [Elysia marginata]|uniref:Histone-lysine N-methyltransferase SETMAR n=1 Tax=Elysia marginata TaxID=1093978 RepID=A0AAV4JBV8_9GAST|nr:histone-lysine N-methyltransferase SETMAR [Elysia marginata]